MNKQDGWKVPVDMLHSNAPHVSRFVVNQEDWGKILRNALLTSDPNFNPLHHPVLSDKLLTFCIRAHLTGMDKQPDWKIRWYWMADMTVKRDPLNWFVPHAIGPEHGGLSL